MTLPQSSTIWWKSRRLLEFHLSVVAMQYFEKKVERYEHLSLSLDIRSFQLFFNACFTQVLEKIERRIQMYLYI